MQHDGRVRIWGWVAEIDKCLRVVVESDGETVMNAMPDRKCTNAHRP
ncbi:hypothetical protein RQM47_14325 [Rubrivirga sp. S365]|uniref:Uncharacterized protein n=1 Tax=Rubrivirga litoralis TaxID=3075598 RepID=A0ABU3BTU2_9BACT|nr:MULTISPECIES: hypothetical protein [unclassified Rubrivirga]MDT0632711.1 hypothetical protein [Rubrivirga sp. F394]MDT7857823.1 hypothetical protein [Rubrivirga sp. S365]